MNDEALMPAADRLKGITAIARFLGETERVTYTLLVRGIIPAGREGGRWIASKRRLVEYHERLCTGAPTQADNGQ
jgi:hypothetical protein